MTLSIACPPIRNSAGIRSGFPRVYYTICEGSVGSEHRLMSAPSQQRTSPAYLALSALPPKADIAQTCWHVRFVPEADKRR
jgi:hypothetical protein